MPVDGLAPLVEAWHQTVPRILRVVALLSPRMVPPLFGDRGGRCVGGLRVHAQRTGRRRSTVTSSEVTYWRTVSLAAANSRRMMARQSRFRVSVM